MSSLVLRDVSIQLSGRTIIDSFSLNAQPGDVFFITGDNGSGKSTLLKAIGRYLPVQNGHIFFSSKEASEYPLTDWHQHIHYLPQHNSLAFPIKVKDLLLMAFYRHKKWYDDYSVEQYASLDALVHKFNINHLLDRNAKELSGGELQLCWLVQSFLAKPTVLLLDEPTQYLDAKNRTAFFALLKEMQTLRPFICLCVTHDLPFNKEPYGMIINLSN